MAPRLRSPVSLFSPRLPIPRSSAPSALSTTKPVHAKYSAQELRPTARRRTFHTSSFLEDIASTRSGPAARKADSSGSQSKFQTNLARLAQDLSGARISTLETIKATDVEAPHTGYIRIVSLDRPKARNAISRQLLKDLSEQVERIHSQGPAGEVRVLIVASEVDESFCAGADLKERRDMSQDEVMTFRTYLGRTFSRLSTLPIPTISTISGTALGGGAELALCTHLRVLSTNALVGLPETRLGIIPGAGGTYRLPSVIGLAHSLDLILSGRRIGAREAASMGFGRCPDDEAESQLDPRSKRELALWETLQLARQIAQGAPLALAAALRALEGRNEVAENVAYDSLLDSKDRREALVAFGEKRAPRFTGE